MTDINKSNTLTIDKAFKIRDTTLFDKALKQLFYIVDTNGVLALELVHINYIKPLEEDEEGDDDDEPVTVDDYVEEKFADDFTNVYNAGDMTNTDWDALLSSVMIYGIRVILIDGTDTGGILVSRHAGYAHPATKYAPKTLTIGQTLDNMLDRLQRVERALREVGYDTRHTVHYDEEE